MRAECRDIREIEGLKARYFRFVDRKEWDALCELFLPDATFAFPGLGSFESAVDGVAAIRAALGTSVTVHHGHMPEIELVGDGEARGVWAMDDLVIRPPDAPAIPDYPAELQAGLHGYGHYHETYRQQDGRWRIATLELVRLHIEPLGRGQPSSGSPRDEAE
ncbi:MAG: nuclear transport factor 2 family protein [Actinobacteria bacterium]|nr:nuclear transport factor 2 family protein [Actinomycetota bacterium]